MSYELRTPRNGKPVLRVFYSPERCDWAECILEAMEACHVAASSVVVVALPMGSSGWIDKR